MRRVLRQDPDVILIGEMRDEETVRTALAAAETGHLVLSTLHTLDATETINRIIDFFPPHLQQQARVMLASTLRGAVSQRLVPPADGDGRVAVCEVMVVTGRVQDLILNPQETGRITEVIAEGEYYGMQTFDQALLGHVTAGKVTEEIAIEAASSPHDFKLMLAAQGQRASGIEQVIDEAPASDADDRRRASLQFVKHCYTRWRSGASRSPRPLDGDDRDPCPVGCCAEIISGKWTLLVIRDLADGSRRFCELERSLEGISPRTLSLRLRALEEQRDRRAPHLSRGPAAGRVRADREGPRAGAADRGHARLRAPLAAGRAAPAERATEPRRRSPPRPLRRNLQPSACRRGAVRGAGEPFRHARPGCPRGAADRGPRRLEALPRARRGRAARSPTRSTSRATARRFAAVLAADRALRPRPRDRAASSSTRSAPACAAIESARARRPLPRGAWDHVPAGRPPARAELALIAFLCRLWTDSTDFSLDDEPPRPALAELRRAPRPSEDEIEVVVPLRGLQMPAARLELATATIVRADAVEVPAEARPRRAPARAGWEPIFLAAARVSATPSGDGRRGAEAQTPAPGRSRRSAS